jgi:type IV pilus assembly protein PilP
MMKSSFRLVAAVALLLPLTGCMSSNDDLQSWVAEVKAKPAAPLDALPPLRTYPPIEYSAQGLRDPFSAPVSNSRDASGPAPNPNRRKEALEAFPLDALRMVGTIGVDQGAVALVLAPDNVTYRVKLGDYVGQNDGKVVQVGAERIGLLELVSDGAGGWLERQASLALEDK